ncbi:alpha/beta hydrolase family protein [Streptomyces thioluteus]|uniref:Alpha/beta hydrolase family protein n=1 Tax=Streptomyces thioluteus TaxID=66431 RepID=A0ABN3X0J8_STRTU
MTPRPPARRARRTLLAALVAASVAVPVAAEARPSAVPAPAPTALPSLRSVTPAALDGRYAAVRRDILAAERAADAHGDHRRAAALEVMAGPGRHFLSFDGRDGGRSAEVVGDLSRADRIAVLVPGSDTGPEKYGRLRAGATALAERLGARSAVVAWLGYRTPATASAEVLTPGRADMAAGELRTFVAGLRRAAPRARTSVLCHSYGSVVCGRAASGLDVADLVLYGSPGTGAPDVAALHTRATVWAGRATGDWVGDVPHTRLELPFTTLGFGTDPVSPAFGAHLFAAGDGGHSDYLKPGSVPLDSIARIVTGHGRA